MKTSCISLKQVNHFFGKQQVLADVEFQVPYGCIYGLLGPSGGGKTTIVKIASGILEASSGEALILGERMPNLSLMNRIGYMAQGDALYASLSAAENLNFFGAVYGMGKKELKRKSEEVMSIVNLENELKKPVWAYSGGMKRRLSLAISLLHSPEVLILDEPTVGIDPLLRKNIWDELYKLAASGITILVTTHVMDEAEKCNHLAMLREGRIIAAGTPSKLQEKCNAGSLEQAFIYYGGGGSYEN